MDNTDYPKSTNVQTRGNYQKHNLHVFCMVQKIPILLSMPVLKKREKNGVVHYTSAIWIILCIMPIFKKAKLLYLKRIQVWKMIENAKRYHSRLLFQSLLLMYS